MKARVSLNEVIIISLCEVKPETMTELRKIDAKRGIPAFFDERGRVWPLSQPGITIDFYSEIKIDPMLPMTPEAEAAWWRA